MSRQASQTFWVLFALCSLAALVAIFWVLAAIKPKERSGNNSIAVIPSATKQTVELFKVSLQTDWYAQAEHGGFYQALAKGFYAEAGLDVTIYQGGPNAMSVQKMALGRVDFAMHRADAIISHIAAGMPFVMVMAHFQHDPQGIMLHKQNPVASFSELDGKSVMAVPGLSWITYVKKRYDIEFTVIPHDFGMERFLSNPDFIQQCLVTNEPYFARIHGATPKVLLMRETGFDPYHVVYAAERMIHQNPEVVRKFVQASIRGWNDFLTNDPQPAFQMILSRNPVMTLDFMSYSRDMLIEKSIVQDEPGSQSGTGQLSRERMLQLIEEMRTYGLLTESVTVDEVMTDRFCVPEQ